MIIILSVYKTRQVSYQVLARDQIFEVDVQRKYGVFIVNDQEQHKPGNHWVLVVMLPHEVIFFDSFAKLPRHYVLINIFTRWKEKFLSTEWCYKDHWATFVANFICFFGYFLCRGYTLKDILKYFSKDFSSNERAVYLQIQNFFSKSFQNILILLVGYTHLVYYLTTENIHYNKQWKKMYLLCIFPTAWAWMQELYDLSKFSWITTLTK